MNEKQTAEELSETRKNFPCPLWRKFNLDSIICFSFPSSSLLFHFSPPKKNFTQEKTLLLESSRA